VLKEFSSADPVGQARGELSGTIARWARLAGHFPFRPESLSLRFNFNRIWGIGPFNSEHWESGMTATERPDRRGLPSIGIDVRHSTPMRAHAATRAPLNLRSGRRLIPYKAALVA